MRSIAGRPPDLVILDLNIPVLSGEEVCRILRQQPGDPPAADHHADGAHVGIGSGFRTRPGRRRLRHQAIQPAGAGRARAGGAAAAHRIRPPRRGRPNTEGKHLQQISTRWRSRSIGSPIRLTRREFELLRFLVENRNRVLSRDRLLERVWGYDRFIETRSVDVHVGRLRAKLGAAGSADRDRHRPRLPLQRIGAESRAAPRSSRCSPDRRSAGEHVQRALNAVPVGVVHVLQHPVVLFVPHLPAGRSSVPDGELPGVTAAAKLFRKHWLSRR